MKNRTILGIIAAVVFAFVMIGLTGCGRAESTPPADVQQHHAQESIEAQGAQEVGMPTITRFSEKRQLKDIYELRDKMIPTIVYITDMNGHMHKLCDSVGYGIPYATQYTNPSKPEYHSGESNGGNIVLPQADPNTLFSPASADGTWVECVNPETHKPTPLYVEPRVIVSPFPLK